MKRSIKYLSLLIIVFAFVACDKDDDTISVIKTGSYSLKMNGEIIAEGYDADVGYAEGGEGSVSVSISKDEEVSVLISSVPIEIGSSVAIDGSDVTVSVLGNLVGGSYLTPVVDASGTITRVSDSKFTFVCTCKDLADWVDGPTYEFEGTIESSAYKMVK
ncbi:hypothetical protein [Marinifilum flexuosum]|uniref:hypothetical protein n=1 Tax=Marinifilum flexuosum TaxID=1117708 RepID=UPI0024920C9E|nr:hypothetical protein [Marinifilum flexuosum]